MQQPAPSLHSPHGGHGAGSANVHGEPTHGTSSGMLESDVLNASHMLHTPTFGTIPQEFSL
jgi:hypothetical protein